MARVPPNLPHKETTKTAQQLIHLGATQQEAKTVSPAEARTISLDLLLVLQVSLLDSISGELKPT